jgi:hypothetical protein
MASSGDGSGHIDPLHDHPAEQGSHRIGVPGQNHLRGFDPSCCYGMPLSDLPHEWIAVSCGLSRVKLEAH